MSASTYSKGNIQQSMYNGIPMPMPTGWYLGLHSEDPTADGTIGELTGLGYIRKAFTPTTGITPDFDINNVDSILFTATGGDWVEATYFSVWDAEDAGNMLDYQAITTPITLTDGNSFVVNPNDLLIEQL